MKGAPLLGVLQRAIRRAEERRSLKESTPTGESKKRVEYKVTVLEKGHPEYERFLALGNQLINNVETALDDIHQELQRLAGRVSRSEYDWDNAIDYVELYSLDPQLKKRKIEKQMYEEEEEERSDSSSYS
jgi:GrpB-like predicted nucleotidyltransferase (UPF0157 family)